MQINYINNGEYLIPDVAIRQPRRPLGRWGRERKHYLKEHRPGLYSQLVLSEKLYDHCLDMEDAALDRLDLLIPQLAKDAGATKALKASDQMQWVGLMNACRNQAEEMVREEVIYG